MSTQTALKADIGRDQLLILGALAVATTASWLYMAEMARSMSDMAEAMGAAQAQAWSLSDFFFAFVMWAVMMVGMMLPAASPMVLSFSGIARRRFPETRFVRIGLFVAGYLTVWTGYSGLAAIAQGVLHAAALLTPQGMSTSPLLAGSLLLAAGLFQWTPLKNACLHRCRTPIGFLVTEWRPGKRGAFVMGLRHGLNCAVCCWAIMALMFVLGVMNLLWMLTLTVFMLIEKVAPAPDWTGRVTGLVLVGWGLWTVISGLL